MIYTHTWVKPSCVFSLALVLLNSCVVLVLQYVLLWCSCRLVDYMLSTKPGVAETRQVCSTVAVTQVVDSLGGLYVVYIYIYIYIYMCMYIYIYIYTYVYIYIYMCVHIYIYIYIYLSMTPASPRVKPGGPSRSRAFGKDGHYIQISILWFYIYI